VVTRVLRRRQGGNRHARAGHTVAELTVTLACLLILMILSVRALAGVARAATGLQERGTWIGAARSVRWVLRSELGDGEAGRDWRMRAPDSVHVRAFRGLALVCAPLDDSTFAVRVRSAREPDPGKDSVLALRADGSWVAAGLVSSGPAPASCPDSTAGRPERWRVRGIGAGSASGGVPVMFRLFEAGSYHVGGATLRYRRGAGGAQPMTEAVLRGARLVDGTPPASAAGLEIDAPGRLDGRWNVPLAPAR
jgi:hypothetical protein